MMKKIALFILLLFVLPAFAQEEENHSQTDEAGANETQDAQQAEETEKEKPSSENSQEKISMTKEEIHSLVQQMVADELAKKEVERKAEEAKKAESEKAEKEKSAKEKNKKPEKDGFIQPGYSKSSVTFVMGDDNLRDNGQYSPKWDIGQRYEYEDFAERVYGYSNTAKSSTGLSVFFEESGFIKNLTARMSLSLKMANTLDSMSNSIKTTLIEDKSYVELDYRHPSTNRVRLTFYPYNAEKIAIGNYRGLKWGSNRLVWPQGANEGVPGFQALYGYSDFSVYFGFKANAQDKSDKLSTEMVPKETVYGFFGGATYDNKKIGLHAHLQGAYIDKGDNVNIPEYELADGDDDTIKSYGIDAFVKYNYGPELGDPIGINTYIDGSWIVPDYSSNFAFRIGAEYIFQNERLENADYLTFEDGNAIEPITDNYYANGAAVELGARYKGLRTIFMYTYRDLPFMTFDSPGVVPFQTISSKADQSPEHLFTVSADYHIWDFWFGVTYGYKIPATYTVYDANGEKNVTVIKERLTTDAVSDAYDRSRELLPAGKDALDIMFIKANIKYQFSNSVTAMLEYSFTQDHNRQKMVEQDNGTFLSESDVDEVMDVHGLMFLVEGRF